MSKTINKGKLASAMLKHLDDKKYTRETWDAINDLLTVIVESVEEKEEKIMEWVSVDVCLPDDKQMVLVTTKYGVLAFAIYYAGKVFDLAGCDDAPKSVYPAWMLIHPNMSIVEETFVRAWMELPIPYGEDIDHLSAIDISQ